MRNIACVAWAGLFLLGLMSCRSVPSGAGRGANAALDRVAPPVQAYAQEPTVRVRVASGQTSLTLQGGAMTIGPAGQGRSMRGPVSITRSGGAWRITGGGGASAGWSGSSLQVESAQAIGFNGGTYAGLLVMRAAGPGTFDVVNQVGMEAYLPGVIERELFPRWEPAAYRAQAIAARSYALVQLARNRDNPWDLESTQASQVYGGRASNPRAIDAVKRTRGQALIYQGRVVEAFFSSCSGGATQDAAGAFVDRSGWFNIPPLQGRRHGFGRQATYYQWGPVSRDAGETARRLAAWGRSNRHAVARVSGLREIQVSRRSASGRPVQFTVIDGAGRSYAMGCEQLRFACNAEAPGLGPVSGADLLRSSYFEVTVRGGRVTFANGRGFGHGVGLDQWAAQDMASRGHDEGAILAAFYPQAQARRLY